jgi:hypothetical protein
MAGSVNCVAHRSDGQRFAVLSDGGEAGGALGALIFGVQDRITGGPAAAKRERCVVGEVLDSLALGKSPGPKNGQQRTTSVALWI